AGPAGSNGLNGAAGSNGGPGANGAAGPAGPAGATGKAGRDATVTCKVQGSKTVKCTVSYGSKSTKSAARLVKNGKTVARGTVSTKGALTLKATSRLSKGTYTLVARGKSTKLKLG
ncbi:MAG: hypothetical protein Q7T55_17575, partial [Solirubrobacteraceae bacterium]|nr:hypothetical protein [Solirubrobacteraceae bacterium]